MSELLAKESLNRIAKYALIGITAILLFFVVVAFLRVGLVYWLWSTVDTWVTIRLGLDYYAAQLLTMTVVSMVIAVLPTIAWYLLLGRNKWQGTAAMIGGQALVFVLVYTIGSGVCFDRRTGESLCWYVDTPNGRYFSSTAGYHPTYGLQLKQYTREIALGDSPATANNSANTAAVGEEPRSRTISRSITIPATQMWYDTGIDVPQAQTVRIEYQSGQWTNVEGSNYVDGQGKQFDRRSALIVPSSHLAALVGKVGNNSFHIGNSYVGTPGKGRLFLSMNDTTDHSRTYADNLGSLTVLVELK